MLFSENDCPIPQLVLTWPDAYIGVVENPGSKQWWYESVSCQICWEELFWMNFLSLCFFAITPWNASLHCKGMLIARPLIEVNPALLAPCHANTVSGNWWRVPCPGCCFDPRPWVVLGQGSKLLQGCHYFISAIDNVWLIVGPSVIPLPKIEWIFHFVLSTNCCKRAGISSWVWWSRIRCFVQLWQMICCGSCWG